MMNTKIVFIILQLTSSAIFAVSDLSIRRHIICIRRFILMNVLKSVIFVALNSGHRHIWHDMPVHTRVNGNEIFVFCFTIKFQLNNFIRSYLYVNSPFECEICGQKFSQRYEKYIHFISFWFYNYIFRFHFQIQYENSS